MNLDEAIRKFKDYCQGKGYFDELDFKEYILDDLFRRYSEAESLKAVREDRLFNAKFYKQRTDDMFDREIKVYEDALKENEL